MMGNTAINSGRASNKEPLLEQPAFTPTRRIRVVCVGAGFAGLMVAHKIQHELKLEDEIDLTIYEKNADVGGTWYENTYPGAGCDVPAHSYVFPFEGNSEWSKFYADQKEILAYIQGTAKKYNLYKNIQLETKILEATWDEVSAKWSIRVQQGDVVKEDQADIIINAAGYLNNRKWPEIAGLHSFKGKLVHSAGWDHSYDWEGKKVAVIGNGASGIQVVAAMQPKVEMLVNYVRSPTWVSGNILAQMAPETPNFAYTEEQKKIWREDPKALLEYRREMEQLINGFFFYVSLDHPAQAVFESIAKEEMHKSAINDPELEKRFTPTYKPGCRRLTPGHGYLEALQQPNCHDQWAAIESITERGIKTSEGEEDFDMIICATGFVGSWIPPWKLTGRDGITLQERWTDEPEAFLGAHVDGFPNYFMITGPNIPVFNGSIPTAIWWTSEHVVQWIKRMNRQDIKTISVKKEAVSDFNEFSQEVLKRTVWSGDCRTFYKNGRSTGRITGLYGGSMIHFKNALEQVGFNGEHFDITWRSNNRFRCLGNGTAETDQNGAGNFTPHMYGPEFAG